MSVFEDLARPVQECANCGRCFDPSDSDHCAECDAMFEAGKAEGLRAGLAMAAEEAERRGEHAGRALRRLNPHLVEEDRL